jgi:DNA repair exonuclease SbcCD ATPase subunit
LGSKTSTERLSTLQNLFRLDVFERASRYTTSRLQEVLNDKNRLLGTLEEKQKEVGKIPHIQKDIRELKPQLVQSIKHQEEISDKLNKLKTQEEDKQKQVEQLRRIQTQHDTAQDQLTRLSDELETKEVHLTEFKVLKERLNILKTKVDSIREDENLINNLRNLQKEDEIIKNQVESIIKRMNRLREKGKAEQTRIETRIRKEETRSKNLSTDIDQKTAFKTLKQEGRLVERIQRISLEKSWNLGEILLNELGQEQQKARTELSDLDEIKSKINADSFVLSEIQSKIVDFQNMKKTMVDQLNEDLSRQEVELEEVNLRLEKLNFSPKEEAQLTELLQKERENKKIHLEFDDLQRKLDTKQDPSSAINSIKKRVASLKNSITEFKKGLSKSSGIMDEYNTLIKDIGKYQNERERISGNIARLDEKIKGFERNLDELSQIKSEVKKLQETLATLVRKETVLERLKTDVFHTKGAPFYAIQKTLPWIGRRASYILGELTNQRLTTVQLEELSSGTKATGFNILINTPTGARDVATFSGGERTQINAALRLAISEELSELGQKRSPDSTIRKTLFIDEGDLGSLDTLEAQQAFVNKLFKLTHKFKIILITHLTEIADQFPHSININRDRDGRSVLGKIS